MKRQVVLWTLFVVFTVIIVRSFTDLEGLLGALRRGRWPWILAAIGLQVLYYVLYAALYRYGFHTVEVENPLGNLVPLVFVSIFINGIAPSAGAGPAALFVEDARRRGQSGPRAAVGTVLVLIADLATLVPFVVAAMIYLAWRQALLFYDIIAGIMFGVFVAVLVAGLLLARWRRAWLRALLGRVRHLANALARRVHRPEPFAPEWPAETAEELRAGARAIALHPARLSRTLALAFVLHVLNVIGLYTLFLGFSQPVGWWTLIAGFGMGIVFWVVTIVPQQVNAAEAIMALVYTSLGIPGPQAVVIAFVFRALNFWLPLIIGALAWRRVRLFSAKPSAAGEEPRPAAGPG